MDTKIVVLAFVALEIVALWFAWRAISSARTSQGAVGWVVFLITAPYLGVPMYLFLGHHKFKHYLIARRDSEEIIEGVKTFKEANAPTSAPVFPVQAFEKISELPAARGNNMTLLVDGKDTFDAIFTAIDAAETYVLVQFYILRDDGLGCSLQDRLIAAAARGVTVRLMFDAVGSAKLSHAYQERLREAGVQVVDPKSVRGPKNRFQINLRNHRKTVVIDGKVGFTGGFNVGDEYLGLDPEFGDWRDTHALLEGPIVSQLQLIFAEDWHWATNEVLIDDLDWEAPHAPEDMTAMIVPTGPGDEMETGALFFFSAISAAKHRVWIASPYFVPDTDVLTALKHAALRGVDVRILVPEVIDHKIPWLAAFAYFDEIRAAGVQVWRYKPGFMHQKVVLVDDDFAAIGTTNLDNRSFRLNFEAMAAFFDARPAAATAAMLEKDFDRAWMLDRTLAEQPRHIRIGAPIARLFAPVL
ncbi:cardiolipin synthase [Falsiphaeobacter marinintestinus]|uniref:cardiolipin synthase n=1 Tax=Falsiphaeobacter marinintestinus TaxID=1492905 RepID=UPI0011B7D052|nr:cardiolipin synthase [Phaeobacter marinintestinus]